MSDLTDLYQEVILDHSRRPRNFEPREGCNKADGHNPLCGDKITVFVDIDHGKIRKVTFQGSGCAISTAAASMMTQALEGKTVEEARAIFGKFHELVTGKGDDDDAVVDLGKLAAFAGVRRFPVRVKCATLAWHTMRSALEGTELEPITTE